MKIGKHMQWKTFNDMRIECTKAFKTKVSNRMLCNILNENGYHYWKTKIKIQVDTYTQYGTNKPDYVGRENTKIGLLLAGVKPCLSMNQKLVLVQGMTMVNSVGGFKTKGRVKIVQSSTIQSRFLTACLQSGLDINFRRFSDSEVCCLVIKTQNFMIRQLPYPHHCTLHIHA